MYNYNACKFEPDNYTEFPYQYRNPDGSIVEYGTWVGGSANTSGVCVFETNACSMEKLTFPNGTAFTCCSVTDQVFHC
jgi:hypothetical protein